MDSSVIALRTAVSAVFPLDRPAPAAPAHGRAEPAATISQLLMRVLDQLDYGVMLLDDGGQVRFANRAALRECAATRVLRIADGQLRAHHERDQHSLMRALAGSRTGRRSLVTFAPAQEPLRALAVVPVPDSTDATALVVFGRRQVCEPLSVEFYAREHRLTAAETSVLRGLADGLRPAQIAREAGVAMSTVRTQITSIRLKTGARSIGDLVRLVTVLPPIVPVLN
jgi:DNA-binding CsgD family transcriptional regulator